MISISDARMKARGKCFGLVLDLREASLVLLKKERLELWVSYQNGVRPVGDGLISIHCLSEECAGVGVVVKSLASQK